jgi:isopentenyl-diphosphate delta-isomerase
MEKLIFNRGSRRLFEEMGFNTELKELFHFIYKAPFDNGLTEHELDHVMIGYYDDAPNINREEVEDWKWMKIEDVKSDMETHPALYTVWFKIIFDEFYHLKTTKYSAVARRSITGH